MTDILNTLAPSLELQMHLDDLQKVIGEGNAARGFHAEGRRHLYLTLEGNEDADDVTYKEANLRNYYMTKLMLITTEVAEAAEELRNGRRADERYYSGGVWTITEEGKPPFSDKDQADHLGQPRKPEGVPSEIADIVIRCFDFADEASFSLGEAVLEKLRFNATRGKLHGGKKV